MIAPSVIPVLTRLADPPRAHRHVADRPRRRRGAAPSIGLLRIRTRRQRPAGVAGCA